MRDPIERVRKLLLSHDIATEKELKVLGYIYHSSRQKSLKKEKLIHNHHLAYTNDNLLLAFKDMEKEVRKEVDDAVAQAKVIKMNLGLFLSLSFVISISNHLLISSHLTCLQESPVPEPSELFTNMYVKDCGVEVLFVSHSLISF